jgi:hypothetical protein
MAVEELIGLQAALGELGRLYVVAKNYRQLRAPAERELLAQTAALGARLRHALRQGGMDAPLVDDAARQIAGLRHQWRQRLEELRASPLYQQCLRAWSVNAAAELASLVPELFADVEHGAPSPFLYYGVSLAPARRGPRPFLSPEACATKIAAYRDQGVSAEVEGTEWWDTELASVELVSDADALEVPVALRFETAKVPLPLFTVAGSGICRAYGRVLNAPFDVCLQEEVSDEWWQAFDESYAKWRAVVAERLTDRAIGVVTRDQGSTPA